MNLDLVQVRIWSELAQTPPPPPLDGAGTCGVCGGTGYITLNVPTYHDLFGKAFHCICQRTAILNKRIARSLSDSGDMIPDNSYDYSWSDFAKFPIARDSALELVQTGSIKGDNPAKVGLLLTGNTGTGKSTLALLAMRTLSEFGNACVWSDFTDLIKRVQSTYSGDRSSGPTEASIIDGISKSDLWILDDLGSLHLQGTASENRIEILFKAINYRWAHRLPMIITSNLTVKHLESQFGSRIMSRVLNLCKVVEMNGKDLRLS